VHKSKRKGTRRVGGEKGDEVHPFSLKNLLRKRLEVLSLKPALRYQVFSLLNKFLGFGLSP
jgi:hypothetical protein